MSTYSELKSVISLMKRDLETAREASNRKYLTDYEQGFSDGVVEGMEATLKFTEELLTRSVFGASPNPVRGDMENEFGDVPPIRQGMGG